MAKCETCGNDYDKSFTVTMGGVTHTFDSFECAIFTLAPACEHCGCRVIGRSQRPVFLLRQLRSDGGGAGPSRSHGAGPGTPPRPDVALSRLVFGQSERHWNE